MNLSLITKLHRDHLLEKKTSLWTQFPQNLSKNTHVSSANAVAIYVDGQSRAKNSSQFVAQCKLSFVAFSARCSSEGIVAISSFAMMFVRLSVCMLWCQVPRTLNHLESCQILTLHYRRGDMIETYKIISAKYQGCVAPSLLKIYVTRGNDFRLISGASC